MRAKATNPGFKVDFLDKSATYSGPNHHFKLKFNHQIIFNAIIIHSIQFNAYLNTFNANFIKLHSQAQLCGPFMDHN